MSETIGGSAPSAGASSAPASSSPSPSAGTTSAPGGESSAASTSSAPAASQPGQGQSGGEPPRERWDAILENARNKTRAEVQAEYQARYGKYDIFERDPWNAVQGWLGEASNHSVYGPMVQNWIQAQIQAQQAKQPAPLGEEPKADIPVADAHGNITGYTYSDKQLKAWQKWNQTQLQRDFEQRLGPLEQRARQQEQREQMAMIEHHANQQASQTLGQLRTQPYFKEHEESIREALEAHPEWGDNVHAAYNHVLVTKILPTLSQAEQQRVVDSINQKAGAGTVSPRGTTAGTPQFKSFAQAARYYAEHPEEAAAKANRD